jgi:hypothetical protein
MKKLIWLLIMLFFVSSCDLQHEAVSSPPKPKPVPESAFWVGGHEGGVFVLISKAQSGKLYFGTIYFDANGEIWYQGKFQYTGNDSFDVGDKSSYTGWDGDFLFLSNGEKLIAVDEVK